MKKNKFYDRSILITLFLSSYAASAEWGPWRSIGDGNVQVRFGMVKSDLGSWLIKNTGRGTLQTLEFTATTTFLDTGPQGR